MDRKNALFAMVAALLLALPAPGMAEDISGPASAYVGVWLLDLEASDSIEPLMNLIDAPWIARKLADSMTPTLTITLLGDGGLRLVNENPIQTTDQRMPADGVEREREDPLGRKVVSSQVWNDAGQLVVTQKNHVDEDRIVVITSTWARAGDHLELVNTAETEDGPLRIRRVFRPVR
jgi:hypothetical protein